MDGDVSFYFDQCRGVDQRLRLWINGVARESVGYGGDGLGFLLLFPVLLRVVELNVALQQGRFRVIIGRLLSQLFLQLLIFFLVWWCYDAPTATPWDTGPETNPDPCFCLEFGPVHDDIDVVHGLALAGYQRTRISLLQCGVLEHG